MLPSMVFVFLFSTVHIISPNLSNQICLPYNVLYFLGISCPRNLVLDLFSLEKMVQFCAQDRNNIKVEQIIQDGLNSQGVLKETKRIMIYSKE